MLSWLHLNQTCSLKGKMPNWVNLWQWSWLVRTIIFNIWSWCNLRISSISSQWSCCLINRPHVVFFDDFEGVALTSWWNWSVVFSSSPLNPVCTLIMIEYSQLFLLFCLKKLPFSLPCIYSYMQSHWILNSVSPLHLLF